jgi:glutathione S-transferase
MKLYISAASPFARKVRVLLLEKGVPHELETVNLWEPNALQRVNPLGKVPALVLEDGRVLTGSSLIADYVDGRWPRPRFIPEEPEARLEVRRLEALADGTMEAVSACLYEVRFHDEGKRSREWLERQRGKVEAGLAALERSLGGRDGFVGAEASLADVAVACHIGFIAARAPHFFSAERCPGLARLWRRLEERDSMRKTAPPPA